MPLLLSAVRLAVGILAIVPGALSQDDLARIYSEAQQAQAAGDLQTATNKYEAIVRLRPQMAEPMRIWAIFTTNRDRQTAPKLPTARRSRLSRNWAGPISSSE